MPSGVSRLVLTELAEVVTAGVGGGARGVGRTWEQVKVPGEDFFPLPAPPLGSPFTASPFLADTPQRRTDMLFPCSWAWCHLLLDMTFYVYWFKDFKPIFGLKERLWFTRRLWAPRGIVFNVIASAPRTMSGTQ